PAYAVFDSQILHRLHEQRGALNSCEAGLQAADNVTGADPALLDRFQIDLNAAAVEGAVGAVNTDERGNALHRRIAQNDLRQRLLALGHGGKRDALWRLRDRENGAGVLHGEKSLRDKDVE